MSYMFNNYSHIRLCLYCIEYLYLTVVAELDLANSISKAAIVSINSFCNLISCLTFAVNLDKRSSISGD